MNRTDRLYALVEELRAASPAWRSATSLAERFEVSSRTIERDLSALQQAGVPIYATPGRRGGYAIDTQHTLPPLNLTAAEVAAVATALAVDSSMPFTHAGRSALQKILAVLSEVDAEGTHDLAARIRLFDNRSGQARPPAVPGAGPLAKLARPGVSDGRPIRKMALGARCIRMILAVRPVPVCCPARQRTVLH